MCKHVPRTSNKYADEGTEAHFIAEHCLKVGHKSTKELADGIKSFPSLKYINQEMLDNVDVYLKEIWEQWENSDSLQIEQQFNLDWLYPNMFGTNDSLVGRVFGHLFINDLKYGAGIQIEAEMNPQLMYYALGALGPDNPNDHDKVILTIIQPRGFHPSGSIRKWEIAVPDLYDWGYNVLKPAAIAASRTDASLVAGEWCKSTFCPMLESKDMLCPGRQSKALQALEQAKIDFAAPIHDISLPAVETLKPDEIIKLTQLMDILGSYGDELRAYMQSKMEAGDKSFDSHYKLVKMRTNRKWSDNAESELEMEFGDDAFNRKLKTIGEMEKLAGKDRVNQLTEKPEAGITLAPISDKRSAVQPEFAAIPVITEDFLS
jgi:hypothetical protein